MINRTRINVPRAADQGLVKVGRPPVNPDLNRLIDRYIDKGTTINRLTET